MYRLAVDPGKHAFGWALYEGVELFGCGLQKNNELDNFELSATPRLLVIEFPVIYPQRRQKGDPNDLLHLAYCAGRIQQRWPRVEATLIRPSQWKGQTPKDITKDRLIERLSPVSLDVLENSLQKVQKALRHNVYDACGIGLWAARKALGSKPHPPSPR